MTPYSDKRTGRYGVKHSNNQVIAWRARVASHARRAMLAGSFTRDEVTPITVKLVFRVRPPKRMPRNRRGPTVKPDIDKLTRAVLDAMTGVVYEDDAQIVLLIAEKRYSSAVAPPGVGVAVWIG